MASPLAREADKGLVKASSFMRIVRLVILLFGLAGIAAAQAGANVAERGLFKAVNHERAAHGLPALKWDAALAKAARTHAAAMAKRNAVEHRFPGEPSLPARVTKAGGKFLSLSENVVQSTSASQAHSQFMKSTSHKANILDREMDSVGIGVAEKGKQLFVVEDFSKARRSSGGR